jgi:hypothetical protein
LIYPFFSIITVNIPTLRGDVAGIRKGVKELQTLIEALKASGSTGAFLDAITRTHSRASGHTSTLEEGIKKSEDGLKECYEIFGEEAKVLNPEEIYGTLRQFCIQFLVRFVPNSADFLVCFVSPFPVPDLSLLLDPLYLTSSKRETRMISPCSKRPRRRRRRRYSVFLRAGFFVLGGLHAYFPLTLCGCILCSGSACSQADAQDRPRIQHWRAQHGREGRRARLVH